MRSNYSPQGNLQIINNLIVNEKNFPKMYIKPASGTPGRREGEEIRSTHPFDYNEQHFFEAV